MSQRIAVAALFVTLAAGLSGCVAAEAVIEETYVSPTTEPEPAAEVTPNPVEPDTVLIVKATATATNGAQLLLEMQVHRPQPWNDVATQTLPTAMIDDCAGQHTATQYERDRWSFTRVNVTAIPVGSGVEWPADEAIHVRPSAEFVSVAGRGILSDAESGATPLCEHSKSLAAAGRGALAVGIPGDALDSGGYTAWAGHTFGFEAAVTLAECTFEITPLGSELGGGGSSWATSVTETACVTGAAHEMTTF